MAWETGLRASSRGAGPEDTGVGLRVLAAESSRYTAGELPWPLRYSKGRGHGSIFLGWLNEDDYRIMDVRGVKKKA